MSGKCITQELNCSAVLDRFLDKVEKTDSCWIWKGCKFTMGYGQFWLNRKQVYAHRISFQIHKGEIPKGMLVCHTCDNRLCVNPDHLFLGKEIDNINDMMEKKRHAKGRMKTNHKLIDKYIPIMRILRLRGYSYKRIGEVFGVNHTTARMACLGITWKHV